MTIVKWDPFRNVSALQDRINRLFEDAFPRARHDEEEFSMGAWRPAVDIYETGSAIVLTAELPGVSKENVAIEVKENMLTLSGERTAPKEIKEESYYRRERSFGMFRRAFALPDSIDPDQIKAIFKDGVLKIEIPKPEEKKPRQVAIKVE